MSRSIGSLPAGAEPMPSRTRRRAAILCAVAAVVGKAAVTRAQTWTGGAPFTNNVNDPANWTPGVPSTDGTANITFSGANRPTPLLNVPMNVRSVTFSGLTNGFRIVATNPPNALMIGTGGIRHDSSFFSRIDAPIELSAAQTWTSQRSQLVIGELGPAPVDNNGHLLTITGLGDTSIFGPIGGTGGLTKMGAARLTLAGSIANTYTGPTLVNEGELRLAKTSAANAVAGDLFIGGLGVAAVARLNNDEQISAAAGNEVRVRALGTFDLNGFNEEIQDLGLEPGASVTTGAGTLSILGNVNHIGAINPNPSTLSGNVDLRGTRTFTVGFGSSANDMEVSAVLSNGGLTKAGSGRLAFTGSAANTYTGVTTVTNGTLVLNRSAPDGSIPGDLVIGDGVGADFVQVVANEQIAGGASREVRLRSTGRLELSNASDTIGRLALEGGIVAGTVTINSGTLTLDGDLSADPTGGATPTIQGTNGRLNVGASRTINVSDGPADVDLFVGVPVAGGAVTKSGMGTLRLNAANEFTGGFTLTGGTVVAGSATAFGAGPLRLAGGKLASPLGNQLRNFANPVEVTGDVTARIEDTFAFLFNGTFGGPGSLTKTGTGTLAFNGSLGGFTLNEGVYSGTLTTPAFVHNGGRFVGRLVNTGTAQLNADFIAEQGLVNSGTLPVPPGRIVGATGGGLDNDGSVVLSGGTLAGALVNDASVSGHGTITGGVFTNNARLAVTGGNLTLNQPTVNNGNVDVAQGLQLRVGAAGELDNAGTLRLNDAAIDGTGLFTNRPAGTVAGRGTIAAPFVNSGALVVEGGTMRVPDLNNTGAVQLTGLTASLAGGAVNNAGTVEGLGRVGNNVNNTGTIQAAGGTLTLAGAVANNAGGRVLASPGAKVLVSGAAAPNAGAYNLNGGTIEFTQAVTNAAGGQIAGHGNLVAAAGLANGGGMLFSGGNTSVLGDITNNAGGLVVVSGGSEATFFDDVLNNGELRVSAGSRAVFFGTVSGTGPFTGTGTKFFEGTLSPGNSPGSLVVDGDAALGAETVTRMEIAGAGYDRLVVGGELALAGLLEVTLVDGYEPIAGARFDLLDAASVRGTFGSASLPALGPGLSWDTARLATDGSISVVPEPATVALLVGGGAAMLARRRRAGA